MYLPTKLADSVITQEGLTRIWSEEELAKLATMGDAVPVGRHGRFRIPQHHAQSFEDAMLHVNAYRRFAKKMSFSCVFRGQTRDYYDKSGCLMVLPNILRSSKRYSALGFDTPPIRESLQAWLAVLAELGVEKPSYVEREFILSGWDYKPSRWKVSVGDPTITLRNNPVLAAILQHYGFPTDHLDVSTDPHVCLWFALHKSSATDGGAIAFHTISPPRKVRRRKPPKPTDTAKVPSLHVYLHPEFSGPNPHEDRYPVFDLSTLEELTAVAQRPTRQSAVTLPCSGGFTFSPVPPRGFPFYQRLSPVFRWPSAIIKLYFPFEACNRTDITSEVLFPKDERLYQRLLSARAPYLAVYA
jgi:FRG domain